MKRKDLIKRLEEEGCEILRHGVSMTFTTIPIRECPNRFRVTEKSTKFWQRKLFEICPMIDFFEATAGAPEKAIMDYEDGICLTCVTC